LVAEYASWWQLNQNTEFIRLFSGILKIDGRKKTLIAEGLKAGKKA